MVYELVYGARCASMLAQTRRAPLKKMKYMFLRQDSLSEKNHGARLMTSSSYLLRPGHRIFRCKGYIQYHSHPISQPLKKLDTGVSGSILQLISV